ncbi:Fe-S cluster assembly protein SufD [Bacteroidales bacterium OttesenSCG-928-C19]|nr:Fe-S cluster assembly protein SufD [Bacteroidales bacterium OttesenSCG-928-C19]
MNTILENIQTFFREHSQSSVFPQFIGVLKDENRAFFEANGFPSQTDEAWRGTKFDSFFKHEYHFLTEPEFDGIQELHCECNVPDLNATRMCLINGFFVEESIGKLKTYANGVIIGSLCEAILQYPELVEKHLGTSLNNRSNGFQALNMAMFLDGCFIYVPDNTVVENPIQILDIVKSETQLFINARNLIYVGKNSRLSLIHCDDSYNQQTSFSNIVTEFIVDENAQVEHYKMQNMNNSSALVCMNYARLEKGAKITSNGINLNGELIRNHVEVQFNNSNCEADVYGLYLIDGTQHLDNFVYIDHAHPDCTSTELFKGILDDSATGVFNGHIYVNQKAKGTQAFQTNRNLLLTDKAKIDSKPFLEIYNDDVKCSHGATIGQLDNNALFYLRSRGISERSAKTLLMYAFCDEITSKIKIDSLRERLSDMIKKRLRGELNSCEHCVLHCSTPEHNFQIKL